MIAVVDWNALVEVLWTSALAGIGVTTIFGVAIVGATRAVDLRRSGHAVAAAVYGTLGTIAITLVGAAIVFGIVVMTSK